MSKTPSFLDDLNLQQKEALLHCKGPLLVLAGAGSGKTRVITYKYAYLVKNKKIPAGSIFTVTFTNKAADEMKSRIREILKTDCPSSWIGTFHSQCSKILRKEIKALGYTPEFCIYDEEDQCHLIRQILKEFRMYEALYRGIASRISYLKACLISPEEFITSGDSYGFDERLAKIYRRYQEELKRANALDFDDLIFLTVKLFREEPKILQRYQELFSYILVDEFQDTNIAQYNLLKLLAERHRNICVVGDDDQSIYKFRGANVGNIINFEKDFPDAKVIKLEKNYRSTQNILDVSGAVISKNENRKEKRLWTDRGAGEKVCYAGLTNEIDEAKYVAKTIKDLFLKGRYQFSDFAVLYRLNVLMRPIEEAFRSEGIPYRIVGGMSFYQRKEIKDILAYIKLAVNNNDNISLRRIINVPQRGIGQATLSKIEQEAKKKGISLFEALKNVARSDILVSTSREKLIEFIKLVEELSSLREGSAEETLRFIINATGYTEGLEEERLENIEELLASAEGYSVRDFLDRVSLFTNLDDLPAQDAVSLMTIHIAKGLEFPVVFIIGLEEGILPYFKVAETPEDLSEERRLFYVAMTRAKDLLLLSSVKQRRLYSKLQQQEPSRFVSEIPKNCCYLFEKVRDVQIAQPRKEAVIAEIAYPAGCRVRHPKWGIGVVRDCYGEGDDKKIMVNFPSVGIKRLAVKFANLERLG
ncbi:MAG: UvrD-helicase domain-containing protein [Thermodesulfovibrionales bacterium]|nr:UvrD-helicase domain-containing protein [Thermodesulfovibrionales bacterium]